MAVLATGPWQLGTKNTEFNRLRDLPKKKPVMLNRLGQIKGGRVMPDLVDFRDYLEFHLRLSSNSLSSSLKPLSAATIR
jgi:hypothetical protein